MPHSSSNITTTAWQAEPDGRGTFSLVLSCVLTLTFCVWSALHLNVPPPKSNLTRLVIEKTIWIFFGIFAPEFVVATAASQYITARWLMKEIQKDAAHRTEKDNDLSSHTWNITQCYYAVMGGITASLSDRVGSESAREPVTITAEGIRLLSFVGLLPKIEEDEIRDKSKADWMAKAIVCIQASWLVTQVGGRLISRLPVSLLEINTCCHVACAFILYFLWWSKPLDVGSPTLLDDAPESTAAALSETLSLMFVCSEMCTEDPVSPIRCFEYQPTGKSTQLRCSLRVGEAASPYSIKTVARFSKGSKVLENWSKFLGDVSVHQTESTETHDLTYILNQRIRPSCSSYFDQQYQGLTIRHSDSYCRGGEGKTRLPVSLLSDLANAADRIWQQCSTRSICSRYYFADYYVFRLTSSPQEHLTFQTNTPYDEFKHVAKHAGDHHLQIYLGESMSDYVVPYARNLPHLTNLSLGQINISRDVLKSVFAATATIYGALHLSAWNEFLPSRTEKVLWITASLIIASSGLILWAIFALRLVGKSTTAVRVKVKDDDWKRRVRDAALYSVLFVFGAARVFLVVEAFVSLRRAPVDLYRTPQWTDFFPHL